MQPPVLYITQETLSSLDKGLVYHYHFPKQQFQRKWKEFHIKANISVSTSLGVQSLLTFICFGPQHFKSLKDTDEMEGTVGFFNYSGRKERSRTSELLHWSSLPKSGTAHLKFLAQAPTWATSQQNIPKRQLAEALIQERNKWHLVSNPWSKHISETQIG